MSPKRIDESNNWIYRLKLEGRNNLVNRMISEYDVSLNPPMDTVAKNNNKKIWWNCIKCGLHYQCSMENRTRPTTTEKYPEKKENCPNCKKIKKSKIEALLYEALDKIYDLSNGTLTYGKEINQKWRNRNIVEVDFILENYKIAIEYDSHTSHKLDDDIERDIEKSNLLINNGYYVIRCRDEKLKSLKRKIKNKNMYSEILFTDKSKKVKDYHFIIDALMPQIKQQIDTLIQQ